jgi:hypothetical protein
VEHASELPDADRPVFLYDGGCGFCTSCARFIERHIPTAADVTPWQFADLQALGVSQAEVEASVQWIDLRPGPAVRSSGPAAIARLLVDAGSYWRPLGRLLDMRSIRWSRSPRTGWSRATATASPEALPPARSPGRGRRRGGTSGRERRLAEFPESFRFFPGIPLDVSNLLQSCGWAPGIARWV